MNEDIVKHIIKLENIFSVKINVKINYVSSREEMDKILGRKTENWVVGSVKNGEIYIFPKELLSKVSTQHKEEDFIPVLKHEIGHLFINKAFGKGPIWFSEGLACILAGQKKAIPEEEPNPTELITPKNFRKSKNPYGKSVKLVYKLLEAISDEKTKKPD